MFRDLIHIFGRSSSTANSSMEKNASPAAKAVEKYLEISGSANLEVVSDRTNLPLAVVVRATRELEEMGLVTSEESSSGFKNRIYFLKERGNRKVSPFVQAVRSTLTLSH